MYRRYLRVYGPFFLGSAVATPVEYLIANGDWLLIGLGKGFTIIFMCSLWWYMVERRKKETS